MRKQAIALAALLPLVGACHPTRIVDHYRADHRMHQSEATYRNCVAAHLDDASKCDALKAIYEEDKATYEKTPS